MSMSDPLADMLSRLRNGQRAGARTVRVPCSGMRLRVLEVLQAEGYISGCTVHDIRPGVREIEVGLRYWRGEGVIRELARISRPGRRVYMGADKLPSAFNGLGTVVISSTLGVITDHEARKRNVGGEVLFRVF